MQPCTYVAFEGHMVRISMAVMKRLSQHRKLFYRLTTNETASRRSSNTWRITAGLIKGLSYPFSFAWPFCDRHRITSQMTEQELWVIRINSSCYRSVLLKFNLHQKDPLPPSSEQDAFFLAPQPAWMWTKCTVAGYGDDKGVQREGYHLSFSK